MQAEQTIPSDLDVVVIGGGPAGATVATLVARQEHSVLLLERESFPRFRIGESLMTETYDTFEKLGMLERLEASDSPVKASVQFVSGDGRPSRPFYFFERDPGPRSYTWQVERAWFDQAMLENAEEKGAVVRTGVGVREVLFEDTDSGPRATGVEIENAAGERQRVASRVVVDASGQNWLIARRFNLRKKDPKLVKATVFAHYENGRRDPGVDEGATIILNTEGNRGWFWYIPLSGNRVSVGVVGDTSEIFAEKKSPEEILEEQLGKCPGVSERLENATRISPVRVLSDFSYRSSRVAGDGWVLVGDAFGFLDPVYSSGVFLALKSGEMAAECIDEALREGDVSREKLGRFGARLVGGMEAIRKLVYAFYTPGFSFAGFIRKHPEHRDRLTDLLIGDVFKEDVTQIFDDMKDFCELPEERPLEV